MASLPAGSSMLISAFLFSIWGDLSLYQPSHHGLCCGEQVVVDRGCPTRPHSSACHREYACGARLRGLPLARRADEGSRGSCLVFYRLTSLRFYHKTMNLISSGLDSKRRSGPPVTRSRPRGETGGARLDISELSTGCVVNGTDPLSARASGSSGAAACPRMGLHGWFVRGRWGENDGVTANDETVDPAADASRRSTARTLEPSHQADPMARRRTPSLLAPRATS